jgi:phytoene/squalene synthetase
MTENYLEIFEKLEFEKIRNHPNILIAASFWEKERYQAAFTCYKCLREIDDLIDCHKSIHVAIPEDEKQEFLLKVQSWIDSIRDHHDHKTHAQPDLMNVIDKFHLPLWPMEYFARSMIYDIYHDGFDTLDDFIEYSMGASVSPASIFVHLSGLYVDGKGYLPPRFNVKQASTPCAMFSYIVHIIRDFQKDQQNNLNYFALDMLKRNGLDPVRVKEMALGGSVTDGFRNMIREYYNLADQYRKKTYDVIRQIKNSLEPRYLLGLLIIFNLYLMVFEKIDWKHGQFSTEELNPTTEEISKRVLNTIEKFIKSGSRLS